MRCSVAAASSLCSSTRRSAIATQTSGGTAKIAGWTNDQVSVTAACQTGESYSDQGVYATEDSGAIHVTVSATVPYPSLFGTLGFDTTGATVTASANAAVMGI